MSENNKKNELSLKLDKFYRNISATILDKQDPITGLFPASTAINEHGNYQDAWVRDNVYSIQAVWGLALAYETANVDSQRTYLLNHSVIRLMRGLLVSMMRQSEKVESFKHNQDPLFALHAKYDTPTGATVVDDDKWGHLQFDATAIYLIMLVRMISAGLEIILSVDEVNFVQNLIHYIGPAYRTGDYGIWERGNKINNGHREINASSVGMVKSALELLNGFNLFGKEGAELGVVHVIDDEIARARTTLQNLLPRESVSKEVDAALLSIIGYPAFSVEEPEIISLTNQKVLDKLSGEYGCKRFLLDGHQSVLEDHSRFYYENDELKNFKDIESEWPLFYTYLYLNSLFSDNPTLAQGYYEKLESLAVEQNGQMLLPELYYVPLENVEAEKRNPHSQKRIANNNLPLVWAQSLFYLARLLHEKLIAPQQLDPQNLSKRVNTTQARPVHVCLIASDELVQGSLRKQGIASCLESELVDITLCGTQQLLKVYSMLGSNKRLGLSGRPMRVLRSMVTSRLYEINSQKYLFLPKFQYQKSRFYMSLDNNLFAQRIMSEANYLSRHWQSEKDPVMTMYVDQSMLSAQTKESVLALFRKLSEGQGHIQLGNLVELLPEIHTEVINGLEPVKLTQYHPDYDAFDDGLLKFNHAQTENIDETELTLWAQDIPMARVMVKLSNSENLFEQVLLLSLLARRFSLQQNIELNGQNICLKELIKEAYAKSCQLRIWPLVRQCAGLLDVYHQELSSALSEILARQKHIVLGRGYSGYKVITDSMESEQLYQEIASSCGQDPKEKVLIQEILIHLATIIRSEPSLFKDVAALRTTDLLLMLTSHITDEQHDTQDLAFDELSYYAPSDIALKLKGMLKNYDQSVHHIVEVESIHLSGVSHENVINFIETDLPEGFSDWQQWRNQLGTLTHMPKTFYLDIWTLLQRSKGVVIGDKFERRNRIDSQWVVGQMTAGEKTFELYVDGLISEIKMPQYRHLCIEALLALAAYFKQNPQVQVDDYLVVDVLLSHCVKGHWLVEHPAHASVYHRHSIDAQKAIFQAPPHIVAQKVVEAFLSLVV